MKLFDNKKAQPKAEKPKQDSSEIEKLRKQNKKLKEEINWLSRSINDLADRLDDLRIKDNERWDSVVNDLKNYIDINAQEWIEEHIDMAKIEDKVLLKVVKATFNNYKEDNK